MSDLEQSHFATLLETWLTAFDDLLTERWHGGGCTLCETRHTAWAEIRVLPCGYSVAATLFQRCHEGDPQRVQLDALLTKRYGVDDI